MERVKGPLEFTSEPPRPQRTCLMHKLRGDLLIRFVEVKCIMGSDITHYEIEVAHRLNFIPGVMSFDKEIDAKRVYKAL